MKSTIYLSALILVILCRLGYSFAARKISNQSRTTIDNCKSQENASDEDLKSLVAGQTPTTTTGKCFLACMMEKSHMIKKGKYNSDHANQMAQGSLRTRRNQLKSSKKKINACASQTQGLTDRCELASGIAQCMKSAA